MSENLEEVTLSVGVEIHVRSVDGTLDQRLPVAELVANYVDLIQFAHTILMLDDPDPESPGGQRRKTITLNDIIKEAHRALYGTEE